MGEIKLCGGVSIPEAERSAACTRFVSKGRKDEMSASIAITNVKVFDGHTLTAERTVVIENGLITAATTADTIIDGQHGTLLPGLIDSHVHLRNLAELEEGTSWGTTTMLDMGAPSMALTDSLRHRPGLADIRGAGNSASAPGGVQTTKMGMPLSSAVQGSADDLLTLSDGATGMTVPVLMLARRDGDPLIAKSIFVVSSIQEGCHNIAVNSCDFCHAGGVDGVQRLFLADGTPGDAVHVDTTFPLPCP
jgi:hypothetical protein